MVSSNSSTRPEVLYVLVRAQDPETYGGEKSTLVTALGAAAAGYAPSFLITSDDGMARAAEDAGLECQVVPVLNPFIGLRTAELAAQLAKVRDVMRVNRAIAYKRPRIVHAALIPGFFCSWLGARLCGAKVVYHIRTASRNQQTRWFEELAVLLADQTIVVSDSLREQLLNTAHGWLRQLLARRVRVVTNGFDFAAIDAFIHGHTEGACRARTGPSPERISVVHVGGIRPDKGQLRFIEGVLPILTARVPGLSVTFVGGAQDDSYAARCHDAVRRLGLEQHVAFTGYVEQARVYEWYRGADIAVLPSEREGLPRAGVEAAAFGLPLVATAVVGNVDVVREGETGFLVPRDELAGMASAIIRLAEDRAFRRRLGAAGAAYVRASFSVAVNLEGILSVYERLLGTAPPPVKPARGATGAEAVAS